MRFNFLSDHAEQYKYNPHTPSPAYYTYLFGVYCVFCHGHVTFVHLLLSINLSYLITFAGLMYVLNAMRSFFLGEIGNLFNHEVCLFAYLHFGTILSLLNYWGFWLRMDIEFDRYERNDLINI